MAEQVAEAPKGEAVVPGDGGMPKADVEAIKYMENPDGLLSEEFVRNPLLQPTNKTAEEIVAEIMAEVSDEGVLSSIKKMGELHEELETKIKTYQTSFEEQMASIQADIDKYWEIDKEYEQYHHRLDELCANDGEKPASQQIKEMLEAFKEGKYAEGLEMVTAGDGMLKDITSADGIAGQVNGTTEKLGDAAGTSNGLNQTTPKSSMEDLSKGRTPKSSTEDLTKTKSPKSKKNVEGKNEDLKGKKAPKKKTVKS